MSLLGSPVKQSFPERFSGEANFDNFASETQVRRYYRRHRTKFMPEQIQQLEAAFKKTQYPDVLMREELETRLNIRESRIQVNYY